MDAYTQLRERTFQKRDLAIREARDRCRRDLVAIEAIARSLYDGGPAPPIQDEPTIHKVRKAIPRDKAFTTPDLLSALERDNPGIELNEMTVRTYMCKLAIRGEVRKLYKSAAGQMLWLSADAKLDPGDFASMSVADAAEAVLREAGKPLTLTEMTIALQAKGYRADTCSRTVMRSIKAAIKRVPGRFAMGADRRWQSN